MYKESFAARLKELNDEKSMYQVSKETGISDGSLYRYMNCEVEIGLETLGKLADYYGVPLDYLVGRKEY